jgi:CheY-like chemotaxis protein
LQRLGLAIDAVSATRPDASGFAQASGVFPKSGAAVSYASQPSEGVLLRFELNVNPVEREPPPSADGARAWIVDARSIEPAVLERRLQRMGWRVSRFASLADVAGHASAFPVDDCPELLLIRDDPLSLRSALAAVRGRMPDRTRCLLLVNAGAKALSDPGAMSSWEVRVEPLSPGDLAQATLLALDADFAPGGPVSVSHSLLGRRKVLVVDDIEINRILACAMLQVLGYEVAAVADGLDAIEHCKRTPPDVVLMDVNMPVLGGIDASRRIVELQKIGQVAPFAIVVATADDSPETVARCFEAGVNGYLCKPLLLEVMRDELRRVGVPGAAHANQ